MNTYLFDIGNVLLAFDFTPALQRLQGENHHPQALQKIIDRKDLFEAGQIPPEEYIPWASQLLDFKGSAKQFAEAWNSIFTPIPETWSIAKTLHKQGHQLILFSNTNPIHAPFITKHYSIFKYFHHAVFSHEIKTIKPNPEFFTRAFNKFEIDPSKTIYIDDLPENIEAGRKLGLKSFCYNHHEPNKLQQFLELDLD